jgi:hypothetical protein
MKIPTVADTPPPLLAPLRRTAPEESIAEGETRTLKTHRRGKNAGGPDSHSWEQNSKSSHRGRSEKKQMRLILAGGAVMLALIITGIISFLNPGEKTEVRQVAPSVTASKPREAPSVVERNEASLVAEAEPLVRKFLEATTVEELLPLVRNLAVTEARIRHFYPDGKIAAPGLVQLNSGGGLSVRGKFISLAVTTRDLEEKSLALVETPQGLKIDWESWVGWSDISWETFLATKPVVPHVFRVTVAAVEYYNFEFADDSKWRSYQLLSPGGEHSIYGYAEKGSVVAQRIHINGEAKSPALMLSLKFPPDAVSNSQVEIERVVADGWVEEGDSP